MRAPAQLGEAVAPVHGDDVLVTAEREGHRRGVEGGVGPNATEWTHKGICPVKSSGVAEGVGLRAPAEHWHDRCVLAAERRPDRHGRSKGTAAGRHRRG